MNSTELDYQKRIKKALGFIEENFNKDINLEQVASASGFSAFHFHRIFSFITNETPFECIQRIRLEKAANFLIKSPSLSITEIALICGYSSSATFARSFKNHFGLSASQYRKNYTVNKTLIKSDNSLTAPASQPIPEYIHNVRVFERPPYRLACMLCLNGYDNDQICMVWNKLFNWANPKGLITNETKYFGLSFDDPEITAASKCRYYAGINIPDSIKVDDGMETMVLPAGKFAACKLWAATREIQQIYKNLFLHWLPKSGYNLDQLPVYELYLDMQENERGEILIEFCLPLI